MRIVIVGAGLAGGNVAVGLREEGFDGEIVVLGDEPGLPFGRPPLSKTYLRDEEDLSGWLVKPGDWYGQHNVTLRTDAKVERVDAVGSRVVLDGGNDITYDHLCIATGCRPRKPDIPGIDREGVHLLRTKADADAIKDEARKQGAKAAVIGMSFIGSEVAASLRQLGAEVTAVFPGSGPLTSVLGDLVAGAMATIHSERGVQLLPGEKLAEFRGLDRVEEVVTESGRRIACTFAVLGLGVEPNVELLEGSGVTTDNGVLVDAGCRTSVENIFAVGDVANHDHPIFGRLRVEHYNNAEKQGRYAARSMLGNDEPYDYVHSFWSDQYDAKIEYVGFAKEWDDFAVRGDIESGSFLGFYLKDGILSAAMGLNRGGDPEAEPESELAACVELIRNRTKVDSADLADDAKPIR
jgi:3-phenylpropionate/trans-cinnamate dioxygenase ferredoxin reductase subunit